MIPGVKSAIAEVNRDISLAIYDAGASGGRIAHPRAAAGDALGIFGGLALLLAMIGLYGVMSYNVARRRNEIGIRMALGAEPTRVLRMVLSEVAILIGVGLVAGLAVAIATTRFVPSFLYGLTPRDPLTLSIAVVLLAVVASLAGYLQARRASRLEPLDDSSGRMNVTSKSCPDRYPPPASRLGGTRDCCWISKLVYAPGSSIDDFVLHRRRAGARIFFDHVQLLGVRMPGVVEPGPVVEADGVDHQRVVLPMADGVPQPIGIRVFGMGRPSIHTWRQTCAPPSNKIGFAWASVRSRKGATSE